MCLPPGLRPVPLPGVPALPPDGDTDQQAELRGGDQGDGPGHRGLLCGPHPRPGHRGGAGAAEAGQGQGGARDHRDGGHREHGHQGGVS